MPTLKPVYHNTDISGDLQVISNTFRDAVYAATGTSTLAGLKAIFGWGRVVVVTDGQTLAVDDPAQLQVTCLRAITGFEPMCAAPTYMAASILATIDGSPVTVRQWVTPGASTGLLKGPTTTFVPVYNALLMACEGGPSPTEDSATQYVLSFGVSPGQAFVAAFGGNVASKGGSSQSSQIEYRFALLSVEEDSDEQIDPNPGGGGGGGGGGGVTPPTPVAELRCTVTVSWQRVYNSYKLIPPGQNTLPPQGTGPTPV